MPNGAGYTIKKVAGDGQTGVSGLVLRDALAVQVVDSTGQPVPGMLVSFTIAPGSPRCWLEPDGDGSPVTDSSGTTSVLVRLGQNARKSGTVQVQLEEDPSIATDFTFHVQEPRAVVSNLVVVPASIAFGSAILLPIHFNGNPDPKSINYRLHALFDVQIDTVACAVATNTDADPYLYAVNGLSPQYMNLLIVPTELDPVGSTVQVRATISFPGELGTSPLSIAFSISTAAQQYGPVTAQSNGYPTANDPIRIVLAPDLGTPTKKRPVYRGASLPVAVNLHLSDGKTVYAQVEDSSAVAGNPNLGITSPGTQQWGIRPSDVKAAPMQIAFRQLGWGSDLAAVPSDFPDPSTDEVATGGRPHVVNVGGPGAVLAGVLTGGYDRVYLQNSTIFTDNVPWGNSTALISFEFPFFDMQYVHRSHVVPVGDGSPVISPDRVPIHGAPSILITAGPLEEGGFQFHRNPPPTVQVGGGLEASDILLSSDGKRLYFRLVPGPSVSAAAPGDADVTVTNADGTVLKGKLTYVNDVAVIIQSFPTLLAAAGIRAEDFSGLSHPADYLDDLCTSVSVYEQILSAVTTSLDPANTAAQEAWIAHMRARLVIIRDMINNTGRRWRGLTTPPFAQTDGQPCAGAGDTPMLLDQTAVRLILMTALGSVFAGPTSNSAGLSAIGPPVFPAVHPIIP